MSTGNTNGVGHASSVSTTALAPMSSTPASSTALLLTTVKWTVENDLFLSDLVQRCTLPHLALVTKGQYLSVGAPNVANPNLKPYLLVHSKRRIRKVLAQVVKVKEGKGQILTDHKLAIPETYRGYFEILSEDGRPVRCIESVQELFQQFPELCLVRQNCKGIVPDADGELRSLYRTRVIAEGEVLTLVGQFNFKRISFLRCFDEQGRSVYMKMNQKAKFSPIAKSKDAIVGVHSIENLMTKRMPLTAKLVHQPQHGHNHNLPPDLAKLLNGNGGGHLVVRLLCTFREDVVFAYAVHKPDGQFLSVPLNAHLKLAPAVNHPQVLAHPEFKEICQSCDQVLNTFFDRISVCNDHQLVYDQQNQYNSNFDIDDGKAATNAPVNGTKNDPTSDGKNSIYVDNGREEKTELNGNGHKHSSTPAICDDEIDQLYDYIRGLAPLPSTCDQMQQQQQKHQNGNYRPQPPPPPPPVETIPSRKSTNSFSSPEPRYGRSPPDTQRRRIRSPSSPPPMVSARTSAPSREPPERKPSMSPVPPEPRAKSPLTQFVIEVKMRNNSPRNTRARPVSNAHMLIVSDVPPAVPDKRLDDVIYGKTPDRIRRLSKSTEKIPGAAEEYFESHYLPKPTALPNLPMVQSNGHDRVYAAPRHHYHNVQQQQRKMGPSQQAIPPQYARRIHGKPRPMSMVIPDSAPLFFPPAPPVGHDYTPSPRSYGHNSSADPFITAYRSFVNLSTLDEPPPPPLPPPRYHHGQSPVHSMRPSASPPPPHQPSFFPPLFPANRQVYHQRYTPRHQYQAVYRV